MAICSRRELEYMPWGTTFHHPLFKMSDYYPQRSKLCRLPETGEISLELQLQAEVIQGEELVGGLSSRFLKRNHGKYMAITYGGKILALERTLEKLNGRLSKIEIKENYYLCRIGFSSLGRVE